MAYVADPNIKNMRDQFFQNRRGEASQAGNAQLQQGEDAIQRRFASMGASGSGAQVAAMQKNREAAADTQRKGLADVGNQELQASEGDAGRSFQSNEAEAARQFQGGLAGKDLEFKTKYADIDQGNKLKQLDLAQQQFNLDKDTTAFNERMAEIEANQTPDKGPLGNLLAPITGAISKNPGGAAAGSLLGGAAMGPIGNIAGAIVGGGK